MAMLPAPATAPGVATLAPRLARLTVGPPPAPPPLAAPSAPAFVGMTAPPPPRFVADVPAISFPDAPDIASMMKPPPMVRFGADVIGVNPPGAPSGGQPIGPGGGSMPSSALGSLGGEWSGVDRWNTLIANAAAAHGVPANLIKAVMKFESDGNPNAVSKQFAQGLMQIMPFHNGTNGYNIYDPEQNVLMGAYLLKKSYDRWVSLGATDPWQEAVRDYIGRQGADANGTTQDTYWPIVKANWDRLNGGAVGGTGGATGGGWGGANVIEQMFGSAVPDWGEFNVPSDNGLYGYGAQYGLNGTNHTGVDVPMEVGQAYYAPMSGVVTCAGTNRGPGTDGGGCAAFGDTFGQGAGRVEVLLDNGAILIFGHSSTSALQPGQRFNAGAMLGTSGGMNSPHIHLEARVRDASTPSGWRIVDPRSVLGGASIGTPIGGQPIGSGRGGLKTLRDILGW